MNFLLWWKVIGAWWKPALLILMVVGLALWFRFSIISTEQITQQLQQHEAYQQTTEKINEALEDLRGVSVPDARKWLRDYGYTGK